MYRLMDMGTHLLKENYSIDPLLLVFKIFDFYHQVSDQRKLIELLHWEFYLILVVLIQT